MMIDLSDLARYAKACKITVSYVGDTPTYDPVDLVKLLALMANYPGLPIGEDIYWADSPVVTSRKGVN